MDPYEQFVLLFARHEAGIRSFIRAMLPSPHDRDEVLQETCLVLWRKFSEFEEGTNFLSWACTIARFEVLKYRRKMARDRLVFSEELLSQLAADAQNESSRLEQERSALEQCIRKLGPPQREMIRTAYAAGITIKEAAERLGRSATALYKALNRIRQALLQCIETSLAGEDVP